MGKAILSALVDEDAKKGFVKAAQTVRMDGTAFNSVASFVESMGFALEEKLKASGEKPVELVLILQPVTDGS